MKNFLLLLILTISFYSCEKNPFDYRTKFTGDYHFEIHTQYGSPMSFSDTSYKFDGNISYGSGDHKLKIFYRGVVIDEIVVYEDGTIGDHPYGGEFESKNRIVYFISEHSPGGIYTKNVIGERK
jgi:hypothetical protein